MKKELKIGNLNLTWVFKTRPKEVRWDTDWDFKDWRLGFWFRKERLLDVKNSTKGNFVHTNGYVLGLDLLWAKTWINFYK